MIVNLLKVAIMLIIQDINQIKPEYIFLKKYRAKKNIGNTNTNLTGYFFRVIKADIKGDRHFQMNEKSRLNHTHFKYLITFNSLSQCDINLWDSKLL